jgi:hypothetical protein
MNWMVIGVVVGLLLLTKALDVHSTWRHVHATAELNPLARRLFARCGLGGGLAVVSCVYCVVLAAEVAVVAWIDSLVATWLFAVFGCFVAWVQWDVARCNRTGRHSNATLVVASAYGRWAKWWR